MDVSALPQYGSTLVAAALHPFGYARVLMQMGYEPLPPEAASALLNKTPKMIYPNVFKYLGHVRQVDGWSGLYRGLFPRMLSRAVETLVRDDVKTHMQAYFVAVVSSSVDAEDSKEGGEKVPAAAHDEEKMMMMMDEKEDDVVPWLKALARQASCDSVARCCGIVASQPFHVVMVRSMAQFVGRETRYNTVLSSVKETYTQDGLLGFFSGLVPRLLGELLAIWLTALLTQAASRYVSQDKHQQPVNAMVCGMVVSNLAYPFHLAANVMAVSGSGLEAGGPPLMPVAYSSWRHCMAQLYADGDLKRGASYFCRPARAAGMLAA